MSSFSYPLAFPTVKAPCRVVYRGRANVGHQPSPLTFVPTTYVWSGDLWLADVEFPAGMAAADAEDIVGWGLALNGKEGSFLMGHPGYIGQQGTWSGSAPVLSGSHAAGVKTLTVRGVDGKSWSRGDLLQLGSGSTSRLHRVTAAGAQAGSPSIGSIDIWPRTREAYSDGAAITLSSPQGLWQLASNEFEWSVELAQAYGIRFSCMEDRRG